MEWQKVLSSIIIALLFTLKCSGEALKSLAADDDLDASGELSLLMDLLDRHNTPQCLRVVISIHESYNSGNYTSDVMRKSDPSSNLFSTSAVIRKSDPSSTFFSNQVQYTGQYLDDGGTLPKPSIRMSLTSQSFRDVADIFQYLSRNTVKVTPFSCVTYMLSEPPDARLLPFLMDNSTSHKFTRYMLVNTQNIAEAESFLLDQHLQKEVNVAALLQEESPKKSYWRVLIRQLLHPSGSPQVLTVNRWSRDTGLTSTKTIFPEQMANFYGMKLQGVSLSFVPFIYYEEVEGSRVVKLKPCIDKFILDEMAKKMNFTYEIVKPPTNQWAYFHEDGYYVGVLGEVQFGRSNFTLDMSVTIERMPYIDYTAVYFIDSISFVTAKNRPDPLWQKLITPFQNLVWLCVFVFVGGGSLLYHVIYHAQATLTSSRLLSSHAFMHVLASFLSQSIHAYLSLQAGRIFLGFWLVYAFLVTSYYKTSLTSTLTVPFPPSTIDTLQELLQSGLSYGSRSAKGGEYTLFATSNVTLYKEMFRHMQFYSTPESMRMVAEGRYAYIYYKSNLHMLTALHNNKPGRSTDLHLANEEFFTGGYSWILPKGVPYKRNFDAVMTACVRAGLIDKWQRDFTALYVNTPQEGQSAEEARREREEERAKKSSREVVLNLDHLQGPFFLLFFGCGGGILLLALEWFAARRP